MIFGVGEDFRLRHFSTKKETPITREEFNGYQFSIVWFPIDLEKRILKAIEQNPNYVYGNVKLNAIKLCIIN